LHLCSLIGRRRRPDRISEISFSLALHMTGLKIWSRVRNPSKVASLLNRPLPGRNTRPECSQERILREVFCVSLQKFIERRRLPARWHHRQLVLEHPAKPTVGAVTAGRQFLLNTTGHGIRSHVEPPANLRLARLHSGCPFVAAQPIIAIRQPIESLVFTGTYDGRKRRVFGNADLTEIADTFSTGLGSHPSNSGPRTEE
jgi:hypothetical protein